MVKKKKNSQFQVKNILFFITIFVFLVYKSFILESDDEYDTIKRRRPVALMKDVKIGGKVHPSSLKLEAQMKPLQKKMFEEQVPIFHDLVVVNGTYFAIFNSDGTAGKANSERYIEFSEKHEWWCDNNPGRFVNGDSRYHTLIVACDHGVSHKIVAKPTKEAKYQKEIIYNVKANIESISDNPIIFPADITHASCTAIKGKESRDVVAQWIEYHRMIGVQHFFIYINEPFDNADLLHNRPYVTYIPFDYRHYPNPRDFYFQAIWQNDCIYRAKNASVSWLGLYDTDEYWFLKTPPYTLDSLTKQYDHNTIVGIPINNRWFGPHPSESGTHNMHKLPGNLLMDYIWSASDNSGPNKFIVNPKLVDYYFVHWVTGKSEASHHVKPPSDKIQMNHYRRPYDHVHTLEEQRNWRFMVKDTTMRDKFKAGVLKALVD